MTYDPLIMNTPGLNILFTPQAIELVVQPVGLGIVTLKRPSISYRNDFDTQHLAVRTGDGRPAKKEHPFLHVKGGIRLAGKIAENLGPLESKTDLYLMCSAYGNKLAVTIPIAFDDGTHEVDLTHLRNPVGLYDVIGAILGERDPIRLEEVESIHEGFFGTESNPDLELAMATQNLVEIANAHYIKGRALIERVVRASQGK